MLYNIMLVVYVVNTALQVQSPTEPCARTFHTQPDGSRQLFDPYQSPCCNTHPTITSISLQLPVIDNMLCYCYDSVSDHFGPSAFNKFGFGFTAQ